MTKAQTILLSIVIAIVGGIGMLYTANQHLIQQKTADRFAGSEAVFLMDKLYEQGICINYTGEEIAEVYKDKKPSERKMLQAFINGKWKCK